MMSSFTNTSNNTLCKRCGVGFHGDDTRETVDHCGFCSAKLGLISEEQRQKMYRSTMSIITNPENAINFSIVAVIVVIASLLLLNLAGAFDSEATKLDTKIATAISEQTISPQFCESLRELDDDLKTNGFAGDSRMSIDAKLLQCDFEKVFPNIRLPNESTWDGRR